MFPLLNPIRSSPARWRGRQRGWLGRHLWGKLSRGSGLSPFRTQSRLSCQVGSEARLPGELVQLVGGRPSAPEVAQGSHSHTSTPGSGTEGHTGRHSNGMWGAPPRLLLSPELRVTVSSFPLSSEAPRRATQCRDGRGAPATARGRCALEPALRAGPSIPSATRSAPGPPG